MRRGWALCVAAAALAALPMALASAQGPVHAGLALDGSVVLRCGGLAPRDTRCAAPLDAASCEGKLCGPAIAVQAGFTGRVTATVSGYDISLAERHVSFACSYAAGSTDARVFGVTALGCSAWTDASDGCDPCELAPPYALAGRADPLAAGAALGGWQVEVLASDVSS